MMKTFLLTFCLVGLVVTGCIEIYADETEIIEESTFDFEELFASFSMSFTSSNDVYWGDNVIRYFDWNSYWSLQGIVNKNVNSAILEAELMDTWVAKFELSSTDYWDALIYVEGHGWRVLRSMIDYQKEEGIVNAI